MRYYNAILAANDADTGKVIFGVIFFVIWAVSQGISILAKRSEQARRRQLERQNQPVAIPPVLPGLARPPETRSPQRAPKPVKQPPPMRKAQPTIASKKLKLSKRPPANLPPPIPARPKAAANPDPILVSTAGSTTEIGSPAIKPRKSLATAQTVRSWLRPATLQQQFILTEIFQPPIALRPDRLQ